MVGLARRTRGARGMTKKTVRVVDGLVKLPNCYISAFDGITRRLDINDSDTPGREFRELRPGEQSMSFGTAVIVFSISNIEMFVFRRLTFFGFWVDYTEELNWVAKLNSFALDGKAEYKSRTRML